jgi:septal ring factor EnvC (AmiA/AmiB activator)
MPPVPRTPADRIRDALATALDTAAGEAVPPERYNARALALAGARIAAILDAIDSAHQAEVDALAKSDQDLRRQLALSEQTAASTRTALSRANSELADVEEERDALLAKIGAPAGTTPDQVLGLLARLDAAVTRLEAIPPR